jgi:hypothetical protein
MYEKMSNRCWHCDRSLSLARRWRGVNFCSDDHENSYLRAQSAVALNRLDFGARPDEPRKIVAPLVHEDGTPLPPAITAVPPPAPLFPFAAAAHPPQPLQLSIEEPFTPAAGPTLLPSQSLNQPGQRTPLVPCFDQALQLAQPVPITAGNSISIRTADLALYFPSDPPSIVVTLPFAACAAI